MKRSLKARPDLLGAAVILALAGVASKPAAAQCTNIGTVLQAGQEAHWDTFPYGNPCDSFTFSYGGFTWTNSQTNQQCAILVYYPECKSEVDKQGYRTESTSKEVKAWIFQCACLSSLLGVCLDYECQSGGPVVIDVLTCFNEFKCPMSYIPWSTLPLPSIPTGSGSRPVPKTGGTPGPKTGAGDGPSTPQ